MERTAAQIDRNIHDITVMLEGYNRDHPQAKIPYRFDYEHAGQYPIALFLGVGPKPISVSGFTGRTLPVKLPDDMVIDYAGAIVIKGDLEGGREIKSGKDIRVEGNVVGVPECKTSRGSKVLKDSHETLPRLKISAPNGSVYFQSQEKRKTNFLSKVDVSAGKQIRGYNYDAEQVGLRAGELGTDESLISFTNNTGSNRFTRVTASSSGGVVLPDCRDCHITGEQVSLVASDDKTRQQTEVSGDFLPGKPTALLDRVGDAITHTDWFARRTASAPFRG